MQSKDSTRDNSGTSETPFPTIKNERNLKSFASLVEATGKKAHKMIVKGVATWDSATERPCTDSSSLLPWSQLAWKRKGSADQHRRKRTDECDESCKTLQAKL